MIRVELFAPIHGCNAVRGRASEPLCPGGPFLFGAAGDEIDRCDPALGSPAHALVLAIASNFSGDYLHVIEEVHIAQQWTIPDPIVRADLTYFECPNGGAVFSVGSISWFGSLSYNGYNN